MKKIIKLTNLDRLKHASTTRPTQIVSQFKIYEKLEDHTNPKASPFLISTITGFLPRTDPILKLPDRYEVINNLLDRMRWNQPDGSMGLLAKKEFGDTILRELTELEINDEQDTMLDLALFRDYSFLTSAYLLEECHHNYMKTGNYGLGRNLLPKQLAKPFVKLAGKLQLKPFMEYNTCYALNNYYRKDPLQGLTINNIEIFRTFMNIKSECGFIKVHVAINQHSPKLIQSGMDVMRFCEMRDRNGFNQALQLMRDVMMNMNQEFERMYYESNQYDYNIFRTFILGIINQPMFPEGVVYEDCFDNKPQFYRGESGANDSIIPFCDNILEITENLPKNPLTDILRDFRTYRPQSHQEFLAFTEEAAKKVGVLEYAKKDPESLLYLIEVADQVRAFRHRHWILTNMYIISLSKHPVATGGSPIITWLPNQLLAVVNFIKTNSKLVKNLPSNLSYTLDSIVSRCDCEERIIYREVEGKRRTFNQ